jgi:hypothetical protein
MLLATASNSVVTDAVNPKTGEGTLQISCTINGLSYSITPMSTEDNTTHSSICFAAFFGISTTTLTVTM